MHLEISIGTNYIISFLYNKLPRRSIDLLYENLIKNITNRYKNHWYTKTPLKGTAYRCIKLPIDPIVKASAVESNIVLNELIVLLPDLNLWIDPGEVCYNLNDDENNIVVIWNSKVNNIEKIMAQQHAKGEVNDENEAVIMPPSLPPPLQHYNNNKFIEHNNNIINSSNGHHHHGGLHGGHHPQNKLELLEQLLPSINILAAEHHAAQQQAQAQAQAQAQQQQQPVLTLLKQQQQQQSVLSLPKPPTVAPLSSSSNLMTTAAFAQTKFGSTKLKINNNKKLLRQQMSPIEFSNYIKSKQQQQLIGKLENIWGNGIGRMETSLHCNL
jgi:protein Tob/BTG